MYASHTFQTLTLDYNITLFFSPEVQGSHPSLTVHLFQQHLHYPSDLLDQGTQVYPAE